MERREHIHRQLREALTSGRMRLVYQPQVRLADQRLVGLEALCRWATEPLGEVSPDEFIPAVESAGLLNEYRDWLLSALLREVTGLWRQHPAVEVAVNFSLNEVAQPLWCDALLSWLQRLPVGGAQRVLVEVTEHAFTGSWPSVLASVQALRAQGVRWAVDDFGVGASEMARLQALPFDVVKLDKSWVQQLHTPQGQARVKTVLDYARDHHLLVVAEGVETPAQVGQVQALGIEVAQGFVFDQAQPLEHWLATSPTRFA